MLLDLVHEQHLRTVKMTVLHRPGGVWTKTEQGRLVNGLTTEAYTHPRHPECVILLGHFTKRQTLDAIWGGIAYTATQVVGVEDERLPFRPPFV